MRPESIHLLQVGLCMSNLKVRAWLGLICLALVMGLLLFILAGTIHYWEGWGYLAVFFGASLLTTRHLMKRDPALLKRRLLETGKTFRPH